MKFLNLLTIFSISTLVVALPAPVATLNEIDALHERSLDTTGPASALVERTGTVAVGAGVQVNLVGDVQVSIDKCNAINKKYSGKKGDQYTKQWSAEITAEMKVLIGKINAYPKDCKYPAPKVCAGIFVKLFACVFAQMKVFTTVGGLMGIIMMTLKTIMGTLLGACGDSLSILVSLCKLVEAKIGAGLAAQIIAGCGGSVDTSYLSVLVDLCVKGGLKVSI